MKKLFILILIVLLIFLLASCNKTMIDTTYTYNRAVFRMPNGEIIDGKVESWSDYEGDQLQVKIDGVYYLVHSNNIVLISGN